MVQPHIDGVHTVRRGYVFACAVAAVGVVALAGAPEETTGSLAVLLAAGALPLTRTFGTIWVNRQTSSAVRATVHSLLAQAEYLGKITCGLAIAAIARLGDISIALVTCGALLAITILLILSGVACRESRRSHDHLLRKPSGFRRKCTVTPTSSVTHRDNRSKAAAEISSISGIAFLALLALIHVIRPDVSPRWQTTSEYAVGGLGWLMVLAFLLSATSYGALAVALLAGPRQMLTRAGAVILALVAIGTVVGGVFVTDPIDTPQDQLSTSGTLHGLGAGLALMFLPVAALLVNLGLVRGGGLAVPGRLLRWTAALPLAALVMFMTAQAVLLGDDGFGPDVPIGWPERVLVLAYATWQITVARVVSRRTACP